MTKKPINRRTCLKLLGGAGLALNMPQLFADSSSLLTKPIPSTGEALPVIGLGTSRVFDIGVAAQERAGPLEVMRALASVKNSMVDTSPMYGQSEGVVGDLGAELGVRDRLFYATKVWTEGERAGIREMHNSMKLLKTDKLDLIQIHNLLDWQTQLKTLREWKQQGKVRYIGITHYHRGSHDVVEQLLRKEKLDFVQINYSLVEPEAAERVLPVARDKGVAVIINRPFARGELFRVTKGQPLPEWAAEIDCHSWAQFFLKYAVSHPAVIVAIPGTSKLKHMIDNQNAGRGRMADEAQRRKMMQHLHSLL